MATMIACGSVQVSCPQSPQEHKAISLKCLWKWSLHQCLRSATVALPSLHGRRGVHLSEWQVICRSIVDE